MSTIHPTNDRHNDTRRTKNVESLTSREQLLGMLVLISVLLLAILLQSM
jgi:hypothetical protein